MQPTRVAGFGYIQGPDKAMIEYAGNQPRERFNHVHMWQERPLLRSALVPDPPQRAAHGRP